MDDRRVLNRWQINQRAQLTFENGVKPIPCIIEDISPSGMRVSLKRNLFDEVFSDFKLTLDQEVELDLGAQVVWRQEQFERNIYGLAFNRIDQDGKSRLNQYISRDFHDLVVKHWWEGDPDVRA
jgi:hypothetical protein